MSEEFISTETIETEVPVSETEVQETQSVEQAENTENAEPNTEGQPEKTFTQAELDSIIQKRLERERSRIQQEFQSSPALSLIEQLARESNMSVNEYVEAVNRQQEMERVKELAEKSGISEEVAERLYRLEQRDQERSAQERRDKQISEFFKQFSDVDPKTIPPDVLQALEKGESMVDAYIRHENRMLKERLAKLEQGIEIDTKNKENAERSTGAITGEGQPETAFFTKEQVERMSQSEVNRNLDKITQSMKHW